MARKFVTKEELNSLRKQKKALPKQVNKQFKKKKTTSKDTSSAQPKKSLKEKVKQQANWLIRDIKSDFLPTKERQKVQDQINKEKKAEYQKKGGFANDKVGQFYTGVGEGFVNSSLPGAAYGIVKGKKLSDKMEKGSKTIKAPTKNAETARKAGNIAGEMLGYATGYGAAEKATAKAAGKALATKTGKKVAEKAVASKVGKKIGKEATEQVLKSATKNAVSDATVGTALDLGLARGEGKKGKELAKDMAKNAAINAATGGIMEAIPVVKALKGSKKAVKKELPKTVKQAVKEEVTPKVELPKTSAKQSENVKIEPKTELPRARKTTVENASNKAKFNKELDAEIESIYQENKEKLADYIRNYKGKGSTTNIIPILDDNTGKGYRSVTSNNDAWYSKALKEYGSNAAVNKNADEIADRILREDLSLARGQQEFADDYLQSLNEMRENNPLRKPNRKIRQGETKVAPPIEQAAKEVKVTPSGKETKVGGFDVEGKQNLGIVNPDVKTLEEAMESASGKFDKFYKATVNQQHEINRLSKASGDRRAADSVQAVRSASGTSEYIFTKNLVNPKGEVIDKRSFKEVFEPVSKNSKDFNVYAQNLNNIARWAQDKPLDRSVSALESQKIVADMLKKHPEFAKMTQDINDYWQKFTHAWLVDTGRMNEKAWKAMNDMYPNYVPAFMKDKGVKVGGSKFAVDAGTKGAKAGTTLDRVPIEDAMMEQVQQLIKSTRKNDMYLSVIDTLRKDPDNLKRFGVVSVNKQPMTSMDIDDFMSLADQEALKEVSSKVYTISAMENGQKVTAYINKDLAEAFGKLDNVIGSPQMQLFANIGKSITNPLKAGITGYNPLFAVANAARDIPTALIQSEYGMLKTTKNMFRGIKEMATNGEMWQKYLALGGKSSGYIKAHKGFEKSLAVSQNPIKNIWEGMKTVLGSVGEATESIPRFAEFISSMEKYGDTARALTESAEVTVNFSRAGEVTKFLDAWTLYLNAAVQGIDKFARTMKAHPARTAARTLEVVGAPYALLTAYNWANPNYQDLNDRTKQNYFCLPNLAGEIDENGYAKTFIKIPLNREYGTVFASTMDVIAGYLSGEANPWNGYSETVQTNFLPPNPLKDNVLAPLVLNLPQNKDFAGRSIVPTNLENVSPELQYDYSTSGLAKGISNIASNLKIPSETLRSPMKVDYLLDSYGGYVGQVGQAVTDQKLQGVGERLKGATIDPFVDRFTADPRFSSGVVSNFYDTKDNVERAANDEKILTGDKGQAYIENKTYTAIQKELSDLSKQEKEILSSNLSKAEKDRKVKAIREQKNEIARSASQRAQEAVSAYQQNPEYETQMTTQQKQSYEKKYKDLGISKDEYAEAKTIVKESGYSKSVGQAYALLDNGQTKDTAIAFTSERAVQRATWLKQAGVTPDELDQVASVIDVNGNGSYSKDEIISYFNQSGGYSTAQKRAIFLALSTAKSSPY